MSTWTEEQTRQKALEIAAVYLDGINFSDVYEDEELEEMCDDELNERIFDLILTDVQVTL